jgi:hypothetical protein
MAHDALARWAGPAGFTFTVSVLAQNVYSQAARIEPKSDSSGAQIIAWFADKASANGVLAGWVAVNMIILGLFLAAAHSRFQGGAAGWSRLGQVGGTSLIALFPLVNVPLIVLAVSGDQLADSPHLALALWQMHLALYAYSGVALGLTVLGIGMAAVTAGHAPGWCRPLTVIGALLLSLVAILVQPTADAAPTMLLGVAGFLVWLVVLTVISVNLQRQAPREPEVIPAHF